MTLPLLITAVVALAVGAAGALLIKAIEEDREEQAKIAEAYHSCPTSWEQDLVLYAARYWEALSSHLPLCPFREIYFDPHRYNAMPTDQAGIELRESLNKTALLLLARKWDPHTLEGDTDRQARGAAEYIKAHTLQNEGSQL